MWQQHGKYKGVWLCETGSVFVCISKTRNGFIHRFIIIFVLIIIIQLRSGINLFRVQGNTCKQELNDGRHHLKCRIRYDRNLGK